MMHMNEADPDISIDLVKIKVADDTAQSIMPNTCASRSRVPLVSIDLYYVRHTFDIAMCFAFLGERRVVGGRMILDDIAGRQEARPFGFKWLRHMVGNADP